MHLNFFFLHKDYVQRTDYILMVVGRCVVFISCNSTDPHHRDRAMLCCPSKHARSDLEVFWLWPVFSQNRAGSVMPDVTSCIQSGSIIPPKAWTILCKTSLDPIWMACLYFGQMHLVRKQASVQESSGLVLAERNRHATSFPTFRLKLHTSTDGPGSGRTQPACYQFPIFRFSCTLPQTAQIIWCKM